MGFCLLPDGTQTLRAHPSARDEGDQRPPPSSGRQGKLFTTYDSQNPFVVFLCGYRPLPLCVLYLSKPPVISLHKHGTRDTPSTTRESREIEIRYLEKWK